MHTMHTMRRFVMTFVIACGASDWMLGELGVRGAVGAQEVAEVLQKFVEETVELTPGSEKHPAEFHYRRLGSEPGTVVRWEHPFRISTVEVTQSLWAEVMGSNPSRWKGDRNSVENLSYDEAIEFCLKLTERLREAKLIEVNELVRLPTEAEWEYAARAAAEGDYTFGNDPSQLDQYAWHTGNAAGNDPPVAAKQANAWGLYDVHGYLWEWCLPIEGEKPTPAVDRENWSEAVRDGNGVVRGGSWKDPAAELRLGVRRSLARTTRDDAIGLRCVVVTVRE